MSRLDLKPIQTLKLIRTRIDSDVETDSGSEADSDAITDSDSEADARFGHEDTWYPRHQMSILIQRI